MANKNYEHILHEHDFQKHFIKKALEVVKNFVLFNKRLLYGGMAIDMSLRMKDKHLYPDNQLPDYDFYSPQFHIDAYNLGELLVEAGLPGISIIRGLHPSTMRVRVNFVSVADIAYIPDEIYTKVPYVIYKGFYIVHPHYQMIDQHRSLSLPFENNPMEVIVARWRKDMLRHTMLVESYPISREVSAQSAQVQSQTSIQKNIYKIDNELLQNNCIAGSTAFGYWYLLAKKEGFKPTTTDYLSDKDLKTLECTFIFEKSYVEISGINLITLATDDYQVLSNQLNAKNYISTEYFNYVLDKIPKRIIHNNLYEILCYEDELLSAIGITSTGKVTTDNPFTYMANLQSVMCYLLTFGIVYKDYYCMTAYIVAQQILNWVCEHYTNKGSTSTLESDIYIKYLPCVTTYGHSNLSRAYIIKKEDQHMLFKLDYKIYETPGAAFPTVTRQVPPIRYDFNPNVSKVYQLNGEQTSMQMFYNIL